VERASTQLTGHAYSITIQLVALKQGQIRYTAISIGAQVGTQDYSIEPGNLPGSSKWKRELKVSED
jgi:hypothetical protein